MCFLLARPRWGRFLPTSAVSLLTCTHSIRFLLSSAVFILLKCTHWRRSLPCSAVFHSLARAGDTLCPVVQFFYSLLHAGDAFCAVVQFLYSLVHEGYAFCPVVQFFYSLVHAGDAFCPVVQFLYSLVHDGDTFCAVFHHLCPHAGTPRTRKPTPLAENKNSQRFPAARRSSTFSFCLPGSFSFISLSPPEIKCHVP